MKRLALVFVCICLVGFVSGRLEAAEGDLLWSQTYNLNETRQIHSYVSVTDDTGVYTAGTWQQGGGTNGYPYGWRVEKRDESTGTLVWEKILMMSDLSAVYGMYVDTNDVYLVGESWCGGGVWNCVWRIEKRDKTYGNLIWAREINFTSNRDIAFGVDFSNGHLDVFGGEYGYKCRIVNLDPNNGNTIGSVIIPAVTFDCRTGISDSTGGYYVSGGISNSAPGQLHKINQDGSVAWSRTMSDVGMALLGDEDVENLYLMSGIKYLSDGTAITLRKINKASGSIVWSQALGLSNYGFWGKAPIKIVGDIHLAVKRSCLALSDCSSFELQRRDVTTGNVLYSKSINLPALYGFDVNNIPIANVVVTGQTSNNPFVSYKLMVQKYAVVAPLNGTCGSSNNSCTSGTLSDTTDSGSDYLWSCLGQGGGTNASCSAPKPINGLCGSANGVMYASMVTGYNTDTQCAQGVATNSAFPNSGSTVLWTCSGQNGGVPSTQCSASRQALLPDLVTQGVTNSGSLTSGSPITFSASINNAGVDMSTSNTQKFFRVGSTANNGMAGDLVLAGDYVYLTQREFSTDDDFIIYNISNKTNPVVAGRIDNLAPSLTAVAARGNYVYISGTNSFTHYIYVVDVSNPSNPVHVATKQVLSTGNSVGVSDMVIIGTKLYLGGWGTNPTPDFVIYDISNPVLPVEQGGYSLESSMGQVHQIALYGNYAFLVVRPYTPDSGNKDVLRVLDITNPMVPTLIAARTIPGIGDDPQNTGTGITIANGYLYVMVLEPLKATSVFNITDPTNPVHVSTLGDGSSGISESTPISSAGSLVYLAGSGFKVLNVTTPTTPKLVYSTSTNAQTITNVLGNQHVYISTYTPRSKFEVHEVSARIRFCIDNPSCLTTTTGRIGQDIESLYLPSGSTKNVSKTWNAVAGTHTVYVCTDVVYGEPAAISTPFDSVIETNESNNCTSATFTIATLPNLVSDANPTVNGLLEQGQNVTFSGRVRNSGSIQITTPFSDNFTYCWGSGCTPGTMIGSHISKVVPFNGGTTQNDTSSSFNLNQTGILRVQHCVDSNMVNAYGEIQESNETIADNCKITAFTITAATCTGTPPVDALPCNSNPPSVSTPYGLVTACLMGATMCHYTCDASQNYVYDGGSCRKSACSNNGDDDGDKLIDQGSDPGCSSSLDDDESNALPTLTASTHMTTIGTSVTLTWDTNNGNESLCTLTGPGIATNPLSPSSGDPETGSIDVTVAGRSTYTLTCGSLTDTEVIEIIPTGWEE